MAEPLFVRESTAEQVRRLRRRRTCTTRCLSGGSRIAGNRRRTSSAGEVPDQETVLIDTALYHAASERTARAGGLVRRDRLTLAAVVAGVVLAAITGRR